MVYNRAFLRRQLLLSSAGLALGFGSNGASLAQDHNHDHSHDPIIVPALATWLPLSEVKRSGAISDQDLTNDMVMGASSAKNTLLVYISLSCGHCAHWYAHTLPVILETYVKAKKLKIIFRELLTTPVSYGLSGTMIARCLSQKVKSPRAYFDTISAFFEGQEKALTTGRMGEALLRTKERTKTSQEQIMACMAENRLYDQVNATLEHNAKADKILHTPWFVINGKPFESTESTALLKALSRL